MNIVLLDGVRLGFKSLTVLILTSINIDLKGGQGVAVLTWDVCLYKIGSIKHNIITVLEATWMMCEDSIII